MKSTLMFNNTIWITWEIQLRNRSITKQLGIRLYEIVVCRPRLIRYLISAAKTFRIVHLARPRVVVVQNPSQVLALLALGLRYIFGFRLIVDEHNAGLFPMEGRNSILNFIARFIALKANYVIVSNPYLAEIVEGWGGKPLILPDPLPDLGGLDAVSQPARTSKFMFLYICGWGEDEPIDKMIMAARKLKFDAQVFITGQYNDAVKRITLPVNVTLTGFILEEDYLMLLKTCDAVIVLTKRDNCLNCGAYEAVAAEKPLILSDKPALRWYFTEGTVFALNETNDLTEKMEYVYWNVSKLTKEMRMLKKKLSLRWSYYMTDLYKALS